MRSPDAGVPGPGERSVQSGTVSTVPAEARATRNPSLLFRLSGEYPLRYADRTSGIRDCRVGKGRPAGSIELRVSSSPSKIPYGGFSPVRLQMDRQWRPSTTSRGLSAVHIRLMRPSYTPPQLQLPGIRDPRRITRSRTSRFNVARPPTTETRPSRGPWLAIGLCCPDGHRLLRPHARLESLPAAYGFAAGAAAPKENGLRWESRGSPIYSAGLCSRAASHTPATRRVRLTVSSSSVLAFTPVSRVRRHIGSFEAAEFTHSQVHRNCYGPRAG